LPDEEGVERASLLRDEPRDQVGSACLKKLPELFAFDRALKDDAPGPEVARALRSK
jgi:hypothetical protein